MVTIKNFAKFRKLLIDKEKTFDSCVLALGMSRSGLRKAVEKGPLPREKIVLLSRHLGIYERTVADIVSPSDAIDAVSEPPTSYPSVVAAPMSAGQFLDFLWSRQDAIQKLLDDNEKK